jgi:SH3-like domain-containing protein
MKKYLVLILIMIAFSASVNALMRSTAEDGVKIYSSPDTASEVLFDCPQHFPVKIIQHGPAWSRVADWQGVSGWVENDLLSKEKTLIVNRIKVNFRSGPGQKYRVVGQLFKGSVLSVLKRQQNWYQVKVIDPPTDETGWIHSTLVWGY